MKIDKENIKKGMKNLAEGTQKIAGKTKDVVKKTTTVVIKKIDQNDDSSFDKEDLKVIKEKINNKAQKTAINMKKAYDEKRRDMDFKRLKPIFQKDVESVDFVFPKLICVSNIDKKYLENDVCKGAIGYKTDCKDLIVVTLFREELDKFGLEFYPDNESDVYYIDPINKNRYIALEDYFETLQIARVNELKRIAQDLGAKYFRVTLYAEKKEFTKQNKKIDAEEKYELEDTKVSIEHEQELAKAKKLDILSEDKFPGHNPIMPTISYLGKDTNIQTLIEMRMNAQSPLMNSKFAIKLSQSSGMKKKDAEKIDVALKMMKISGNTTILSEVNEEYRKYFEYEIEF